MESRNLILAIILSIGILFIWSFFFEAPEQQNLDEFSLDEEVSEVNSDELDMEAIAEIEDSLGIDNANTIDLSEALSKDQRVNINTQSISGSINLKGLKIDDIVLKKYNETQEEESENIRLLQPLDTFDGYEVTFGWIKNQDAAFETPNAETVWKIRNNVSVLDTSNEVEFEWSNKTGQTFITSIALDEDYMFDVTQKVINDSTDNIVTVSYTHLTLPTIYSV